MTKMEIDSVSDVFDPRKQEESRGLEKKMAGLRLCESKRLGKKAALHHPAPNKIIKKPKRILKGCESYLSELFDFDAQLPEEFRKSTADLLAIDAECLSKFFDLQGL